MTAKLFYNEIVIMYIIGNQIDETILSLGMERIYIDEKFALLKRGTMDALEDMLHENTARLNEDQYQLLLNSILWSGSERQLQERIEKLLVLK